MKFYIVALALLALLNMTLGHLLIKRFAPAGPFHARPAHTHPASGVVGGGDGDCGDGPCE